MKAKRNIHPVLFAVYPILFLYYINIDQVNHTEIIIPLILSLLFTISLWLIANKVFKFSSKIPIILSIFLVWFYSYGHVALYLFPNGISQRKILPVWCLFIVLMTWGLKKLKGKTGAINSFLNVVGATLCCFIIYNIGAYKIAHAKMANSITKNDSNIPFLNNKDSHVSRPDIYYIIIDSYAGQLSMRDLYAYDNSAFTQSLKKQGFIIDPQSRSNYPFTLTSMAATLNMSYLDRLTGSINKDSHDLAFLLTSIRKNAVTNFLSNKGYKCIFITSPADIKFGFSDMLLNTSLLRIVQWDYSNEARNQTLTSFKTLEQMPHTTQPFFVYAHIYCPHPPYVFGPNGEKVSEISQKLHLVGLDETKRLYINQSKFTEKKVMELVDAIMAKSSEKPIIIIQADHGPKNCAAPWKINDTLLKERFSIINAYYFPQNKETTIYKGITPVNTFRTVFNTYFNTALPMLPDKQYYCTYEKPYRFNDVTADVNRIWLADKSK